MTKRWLIVEKPEGLCLYKFGTHDPIPYDNKILEEWLTLGKVAGHYSPAGYGFYASLRLELDHNKDTDEFAFIRTIAQ